MKLLTVAQLQTRVYAQKENNLSPLDGLFCQAKDAGADMICLPEMFSCPYETPNFPVYAEPTGVCLVSRLRHWDSMFLCISSMVRS